MMTVTHTHTSRLGAPVLTRQLLDGWRGLLGWALGISAAICAYLPLFPSLQSPELRELVGSLPDSLVSTLGFDQITSGAGYTQATFFGLLGFVLATIAGTIWGAAAIAGAEETGYLELTLAHAVGRRHYALASATALVVRMLGLGAITFALILSISGPAGLGLSASNLLAATLAWTGLTLMSGATALAVGAASGRRSWAVGAGAGIAAAGYVLDAVGKSSDELHAVGDLSPYRWAFGKQPLAEGFDWGGLGLLWGLVAALVGVTVWALARRDIQG